MEEFAGMPREEVSPRSIRTWRASDFNFLWERNRKDSRNRRTLELSNTKKNWIFSLIAMTISGAAESPTPAAAVNPAPQPAWPPAEAMPATSAAANAERLPSSTRYDSAWVARRPRCSRRRAQPRHGDTPEAQVRMNAVTSSTRATHSGRICARRRGGNTARASWPAGSWSLGCPAPEAET